LQKDVDKLRGVQWKTKEVGGLVKAVNEINKTNSFKFSLEKRIFSGNITAFKHKSLKKGWYFDQERK